MDFKVMCLFAAKRDQGRSEDGVRKKMHDTLPNDTVCCSQNVLRTDQRAATNEFSFRRTVQSGKASVRNVTGSPER